MKKYVISYSGIFAMAFGEPWIVQIEGYKDCYKFKTVQEARDFVAARGDGELIAVHTGERAIYERWKKGTAA